MPQLYTAPTSWTACAEVTARVGPSYTVISHVSVATFFSSESEAVKSTAVPFLEELWKNPARKGPLFGVDNTFRILADRFVCDISRGAQVS